MMQSTNNNNTGIRPPKLEQRSQRASSSSAGQADQRMDACTPVQVQFMRLEIVNVQETRNSSFNQQGHSPVLHQLKQIQSVEI